MAIRTELTGGSSRRGRRAFTLVALVLLVLPTMAELMQAGSNGHIPAVVPVIAAQPTPPGGQPVPPGGQPPGPGPVPGPTPIPPEPPIPTPPKAYRRYFE